MVLFGITGTGKSSTINHLLGFHVCKHAEDKSCTRIVDEQIITIDESSASEYLHSGKLSIIDTPGFFDTKHSSKTPQVIPNLNNKNKIYVPICFNVRKL